MDDFQSTTEIPELPAETDEVEPVGDEESGEPLSTKIADFLRLCWLKRKIVFSIVGVGILVSILYAILLPNVYTSSTSLMPPDSTASYANILGMLSPSGSVSDIATQALGLETPSDLYISILESRSVQNGVINRLNLTRYYRTLSMDEARKSLVGDTKIEADRKSEVITIWVTARNPVVAAGMAQEYVEELNRVVTQNSTSSARRERIFLEERVKDIKQQLDDSAQQLSQFSAKSGAIDISSQTKSMVEEGLRLQAELIDGRSQLAALRQTYSEDNSRVRALEAHNAELQREVDKLGGMSQASGASIDPNGSPYPTAMELPALGLTYYDLERKLRVDEALWEALTRQYEAAKVEEAAEIPTVNVLDVANTPERKSGPSRRSIVEVGAIFSFILACVVVFIGMIWERMDPESETKRLLTDVAHFLTDSSRWYWKLPGMGRVLRHLTDSEVPG